eukprot:scaffold183121_cov61-Attheya_sp.AAC.3
MELVKQLANKTASQWRPIYSKVCGYFKACMSIAILHAMHNCLRDSRVSVTSIRSSISNILKMGAGLGLILYE